MESSGYGVWDSLVSSNQDSERGRALAFFSLQLLSWHFYFICCSLEQDPELGTLDGKPVV